MVDAQVLDAIKACINQECMSDKLTGFVGSSPAHVTGLKYYLLGTFLRSRGLKLFAYNPVELILFEVHITYSNTIHLIDYGHGLTAVDFEAEKTNVDSRNIYFEALNMKSAQKRLEKYKSGKIKELLI